MQIFVSRRIAGAKMATCTRNVWKVLTGCRQQLLNVGRPVYLAGLESAPKNPHIRTFAAVKALKKGQKEETKKEVKKERRVIDDKDRPKPYGLTAWAPVDDVYIRRFYPRIIYSAAEAIDMLKKYQKLDFTPPDQNIYVDLKLDMKLEKKKKIDPFISTVHLPHPFRTDTNKVLVFTEDPVQARTAQENGASVVGGTELIQAILDDKVSADFYVAVPDILPKLVPLKSKLRKKFPKSKRGTVGVEVSRMLELFKTGHEYLVESECYIRTQIAKSIIQDFAVAIYGMANPGVVSNRAPGQATPPHTSAVVLDMPIEHIFANLQAILMDICSHRPANTGPFIERAILSSQTSEAVWFKTDGILPEATKEE